jgi:hypothetical protein
MSCGLTCRRYFLPVGFFAVDEAWLPMPEGCVWPGLAGPEAGLLAGIVGLGAGFHGSMAVFLNAPPSVGGRFGMTILAIKPLSDRLVTFSLPFERPWWSRLHLVLSRRAGSKAKHGHENRPSMWTAYPEAQSCVQNLLQIGSWLRLVGSCGQRAALSPGQ